MSKNKAALELLQQVASMLKEDTLPTATVQDSVLPPQPQPQPPPPPPPYSKQSSEIGRLFAPYNARTNSRNARRNRSLHAPITTVGTWTHKFCCLADPTQTVAPNRVQKAELFKAGLGEKRITLERNDRYSYMKEELEKNYPKLAEAGGFLLLRSGVQRQNLEEILIPANGYNIIDLADKSNIGQAVVYVRPLQVDLSLTAGSRITTEFREKCLTCGVQVQVDKMLEHLEVCTVSDDEHEDDTQLAPQPKKKKRLVPLPESVQTPVCQYACMPVAAPTRNDHGDCPVCGKRFTSELLPVHAATCGDCSDLPIKEDNHDTKTLTNTLNDIGKKLSTESWNISIVRHKSTETIIDQLQEASESDWTKSMRVKFIGEEAVDAGGPRRELFSILFNSNSLISENSLTFSSELLKDKSYYILGRAVSYALIIGHPGPRNLHVYLVNYITNEKIPSGSEIVTADIENTGVRNAIDEIANCTSGFTEVAIEHAELLEKAGFCKVLSENNKDAAVDAMKVYWMFYRILGPLRQFIDGLRDKGVLSLLKAHQDDALNFLAIQRLTGDSIKDFYKYNLSTDDNEKALEEVIMYNFHKFLTQVERGRISVTKHLLHDTESPKDTKISLEDVLQAFLGCRGFPTDIGCGLILFDHTSQLLSTVNTCAPSITIRQLKHNQEYDSFKATMLDIIIGCYGFGIE